ncbi:HAD-IB family hydrolase [Comamonadaceae bacterium G21597-S1]|nr:HAD-IB family hydrolase [Comamonadaceae bacterium G21597-S1]
MTGASLPRLALFDLDHTLLLGDSDVLWCDFLMDLGELDRAVFAARSADIEARYKAGTVDAAEFAQFYLSTLKGRTPAQWEPLRQQFLREQVVPRIPPAARELVQEHQRRGDLVVLTTATNRFLTTLTAEHLGIADVIATEPELVDGVFSGGTTGVLNMRSGKVTRLHDWLAQRGRQLAQFDSTAYSDSINDLPLLEAANHAVVVHADARLAAIAAARGWRTMNLSGGTPGATGTP